MISTRAKSLWARIETISEDAKDEEQLHLAFYTIWGSRLSVRLLNSTDEYIFNRLPNKDFTKSLKLNFNDTEIRHCLAFSIQELDKSYDSWKAATFFLPKALMSLPEAPELPKRYFCSEFICYMFKQLHYIKDICPEQITPNHLLDIYEQLEAEIKYKQDLKCAQLRIAYTILFFTGLRVNEMRFFQEEHIQDAIKTSQFSVVHYKQKEPHIHVISDLAVKTLKELEKYYEIIFIKYKYKYLFEKKNQ